MTEERSGWKDNGSLILQDGRPRHAGGNSKSRQRSRYGPSSTRLGATTRPNMIGTSSMPSVRCQHRFADRNRSHTFVFASAIASRSAAADGHSIDNLRRLASAERLISGCFSVCFTFHRDTEAAKPKPRGAQKSAGDLFTPATPKSGSKSD